MGHPDVGHGDMRLAELVKGEKYLIKYQGQEVVMVYEAARYTGTVALSFYEEFPRINKSGEREITRRYQHGIRLSQVVSRAE